MARETDLRYWSNAMSYSEGMRAYEAGRFAEAALLFTHAIAASDNVAKAYSKRGVCNVRMGDRGAAEKDFRAALTVDDRCLSAMVNLGNLMLEQGQLDEAQLCYERALRLDETYPLAHHNLGILLRRNGDYAASVRELRLAAKYESTVRAERKRFSWRRR